MFVFGVVGCGVGVGFGKHRNYVTMPGSENDIFNQGAPAIVTGVPSPGEDYSGFTGGAITLSPTKIRVDYMNESGVITDSIDVVPGNI